MPLTTAGFPDVLDARFAKIFTDRYKQVKDFVPLVFTVQGPQGPQKADYRTSSIGAYPDIPEFTGTVTYQTPSEGYDVTITPKEYAAGLSIERRLFEDELFNVIDARPRSMSDAYARTRQKHAAQIFNNAFSVDSTWLNHTEAVALCSNSHTTRSGASTTSGFDNLVTAALNSVSLAAVRIAMKGFRGDQAERIEVNPDELWVPVDLYQTAHEIIESEKVPETANNASNVHNGQYTIREWIYLSDVNNWFVCDGQMRKDSLIWFDRVPYDFAMVEDFDTFVGKWRMRARHGHGWQDWRFVNGASVS